MDFLFVQFHSTIKRFLIILYLFWFYINPYQIDIEHWAKVKSEKKLIKHK